MAHARILERCVRLSSPTRVVLGENVSVTAPDLRATLRETFGFEQFNTGQEEVITRIMAGDDVLAILATGAGKSLCYQLPALVLPGTTIVVSPLIALMKDQLDMLHALGIEAVVALNSTLSEDQEAV